MRDLNNTPFGQFLWFIGIAEDIFADPSKLGRIKVRAFGFHPSSEVLPTENLPLAPVLNGGTSSVKQGQMVLGFFMDGDLLQQPFILGIINGGVSDVSIFEKIRRLGKDTVNDTQPLEDLGDITSGTNGDRQSILEKALDAAGYAGCQKAMIMAQCAHETGNFKYMRELGNERYFNQYDIRYNRKKALELGNINPGDGAKYRGRGYIQITGRSNYSGVSKAIGVDLVNNPELLEQPETAAKAVIWFFRQGNGKRIKDLCNVKETTLRVNGGYNGLADRTNKYDQYKDRYGVA
jgi:putative chitinase